MLGTQTFDRSAAIEIECPFTGVKLAALPALYPDVSVIHVHEADRFGNGRILGISVADLELARASKRLIVSCERLVDTEDLRREPWSTDIPAFCVDAVCVVPGGSYPGNMPGEYFSDEDHLRRWLEVEADEDQLRAFLKTMIYDVPDFEGYLQLCGGVEKMKALRAQELLLPGKDR